MYSAHEKVQLASAAFIVLHGLLKNDEADVDDQYDGNHTEDVDQDDTLLHQVAKKQRVVDYTLSERSTKRAPKRKLPILRQTKNLKWPLKRRRFWMRSLFTSRHENNGTEIGFNNQQVGSNFDVYGISSQDFEKLIQLLGPKIYKQDTYFREAIPVKDRLGVTLRFLASGDTYRSLSEICKISSQSISAIVPQVCCVIAESLKDHLKMPSTTEEWLCVCDGFEKISGFPHCLGVIGGKHIILPTIKKSERDPLSEKSAPSIVLFAVTDHKYNFTFASISRNQNNFDFFSNLENSKSTFPQPDCLAGRNTPIPFVFVGDEAFQLKANLMIPFPAAPVKNSLQDCFNNRISNVNAISERAFLTLASHFGVLRKPLNVKPEKAESIVLSTVYLHNFLKNSVHSGNLYTLNCEKQYQTSMLPLKKMPRKAKQDAENVRMEFAEYCAAQHLSLQYVYS